MAFNTGKGDAPCPEIRPVRCNKQKTAFIFSGGGARGAYQVGVWQGLREMGIAPDMVMGTSVGSINAALVAQDSFDLAFYLWKQLDTTMVFDIEEMKSPNRPQFLNGDINGVPWEELTAYLKGVTRGGVGASSLEKILHEYIDEEKVRKSKIDYGLVTVEMASRKTRYMGIRQIPRGQLIPFILASSSFYPFIKAYEIDGVKYVDGGYGDNMPVQMALERGASYVIAADLNAVGFVRDEAIEKVPEFRLIRCRWDLGNMLVFNEENAVRIMDLGYYDCLKNFGFFDGSLYCFMKGSLNARALRSAEAAGRLFELNPATLYTKETYNDQLQQAVLSRSKMLQKEINALKSNLHSPFKALGSLPDFLKEVDRQALVLFLADYIREHPEQKSIFTSPAMRKIIGEELAAIRYLLWTEMIPDDFGIS